jgi:hypothetical protein
VGIAKQRSLGPAARKTLLREVEGLLAKMHRTATRDSLSKELRRSLGGSVGKLEKQLVRVSHSYEPTRALSRLSASKRKSYQQVFDVIYACSTNQTSAQSLVARILNRLSEANNN